MARYNGRSIVVKIGATAIAVVVEKTFTHAREGIDVTSDDDDGWRTLLPEPGSRSIDVPVSGVCDTVNIPQLQGLWSGNANATVTLEYPDGSTASAAGGFFLNGLEISGSQDGEAAFSCTLQSSGVVTITAAP